MLPPIHVNKHSQSNIPYGKKVRIYLNQWDSLSLSFTKGNTIADMTHEL